MQIFATTGREFEGEMFGCAADFSAGAPPYVDFQTALQYVRKAQPEIWDPANPHTELGRRLYRRLDFSLKGMNQNLRIYCALGSILDFYHGIDGFVETTKHVSPDQKYSALVTFDLSLKLSRRKEVPCKADFLLIKGELEVNLLSVCDRMTHLLRNRMCRQYSRE